MKRSMRAMWNWWTVSGITPEEKTAIATGTSACAKKEDYRFVVVVEGGFTFTIKEPLNPKKKSEQR